MQLKKIEKENLQFNEKYLVFVGEHFFTSCITRNIFGDYFSDLEDNNVFHVNEVSAIFQINKSGDE